MNFKNIKKYNFFFALFLIFMLHIPMVFAKNNHKVNTNHSLVHKTFFKLSPITKDLKVCDIDTLNDFVESVIYQNLNLGKMGLSAQAFQFAIKGFKHLKKSGKIKNQNVISIIDFTLPSRSKRLFIIDVSKSKLLFNTYVAHGMNSGVEYASDFSNIPESNKSSLGFYETEETYTGKNGFSLHLQGLEKGINDNADRRSIVMHGADYVNENLINEQGYIGRSWGCPAVPEKLSKPIINKIKNGTCLFIYSANKSYTSKSKIIKSIISSSRDV